MILRACSRFCVFLMLMPLVCAGPLSAQEGKRSSEQQEKELEALAAVPEIRLFSDEQVQDDLDRKYLRKYRGSLLKTERPAFVYTHNREVHQAMTAAGLREGLPLQTKGGLLPEREAAVMQSLSKELRDLGFVSVATSKGTPAERAKAFEQWCAGNRVEKFAGVPATLEQMLQVEDDLIRMELVKQLAKIKSPRAGAQIAKRALYDLSPQVRNAAVQELEKRSSKEYDPALLKGLRYPWPAVAERAADALGKLKPQESIPALVEMLEMPDPCAPIRDPKSKRLMITEMVRLSHLRNCLLCHVPSANDKDGLVRATIPPPPLFPGRDGKDETLERLRRGEQPVTAGGKRQSYYSDALVDMDFVRADITLIRQDFSTMLKVKDAGPWPEYQRFDFVLRQRRAKPEDLIVLSSDERDYPQRRAVLRALREITGKDGGDSPGRWRELVGGIQRDGR